MADISTYWNGGNDTIEKNSYYYAGFLERFLAQMLDTILVLVYGLILLKIIGFFINPDFIGSGNLVGQLVIGGGTYLYFILFTAIWGMTPGKKLFGLKVLKKDFTKLSLLRTILREVVGRFVAATVILSYLAIIFSGRKRGLHDLIGGTIVVRNSPRTSYQRTVYLLLTCLLFLLPFIGVALIAVLGIYNPFFRKSATFPESEKTNYTSVTASPQATPTLFPQPSYMPIPIVGPTDNWDKYINTAYHFSLKFPPGFIYNSANLNDYPNVQVSPNVQIVASDLRSSPWKIEIIAEVKKQSNISLIDYVTNEIDSRSSFYRPDVPKLVILFTTVIDGHNAVFYGNNNANSDYLVMGAFIEKDTTNLVSIITFPDSKADRDGYTKFLYQIVSTFNFD